MISVRKVHKHFGHQTVLDGIDLEIEAGRITAIVGPSGAGKSVLLKLIMGIMDPDAGSILVCGENITEAKGERRRNEIRQNLGVLFQSAALLDSLSIYENVAFPLRERLRMNKYDIHEKVVFMLESLSLEEHARKLPQEVSIGMRKRAGMARALITEPKILLFDEPNTGLDPLVGQEVYDLIKLCHQRWHFTGVVISHELPEVFQLSDRVAMLLHGKIVALGSPAELISSEEAAVKQFLEGRIDGPIKIQ